MAVKKSVKSKHAPCPPNFLGEPHKSFAATFSAATAIREHFSPATKENIAQMPEGSDAPTTVTFRTGWEIEQDRLARKRGEV